MHLLYTPPFQTRQVSNLKSNKFLLLAVPIQPPEMENNGLLFAISSRFSDFTGKMNSSSTAELKLNWHVARPE